ncbi:hypothetical protein V5O48_018775, partial [Marasmius crinis-equi]
MTKALSLVIAARLHTIRSADGTWPSCLLPPADAIEEGERINAFWTVLSMNNCWTAIDSSPSSMMYTDEPGMRIDTPWPEDTDTYAMTGIQPTLTGSYSVQRFLAGLDNADAQSWAALDAKASILFERATQIGIKHWDNITEGSPDIPRSTQEFMALGTLIQTLSQQVDSHTSSPRSTVASILLNGASMRLHRNFVDNQAQSRQMTI